MDRVRSRAPAEGSLPDADARLLEQIRSGDAGAGHGFVREHYPAVYRYLLYLTGKRELAEDLTQETFLQGWRRLDTFQGQGALRTWLLRIARREFLQALRRQRAQASLEEMGDVAAPNATAWTDAVALREAIDRLPLEQREVVLLHYLEGYSSAEIAAIVHAPAGTVRYRLARAREQLWRELGEGDLIYLNEPLAPMRTWAWLPLDQMQALETRLARADEAKKGDEMRRREFLRHTAAGAAGLMLPEQEVVDGRLAQRVALAFKGTALSDVCAHLQSETGVRVTAGSSVADEKVTVFCEKLLLRDVMRQLSRPFGYAWLRSGTPGDYRYELAQDMRSQLLEEELRSRDRNAALLALDREMERYRPYLGLSPEEAEARARTASPNEKPLLENLARYGWGPVQLYFRLSAHDMAALRAGQTLVFSAAPRPGEQPLPSDVARGVLQGLRNWRVARDGEAFYLFASHWWDKETPDVPPGIPQELTDVAPPASRPQVRVRVDLSISQSELGRLAFGGGPLLFTTPDYPVQFHAPRGFDASGPNGPWAVAANPLVLQPDNETRNARLARDPALRAHVTVRPQPSCSLEPYPGPLRTPRGPASALRDTGPRVTSADVLEALHQATGLPIVSHYYTHLLKPEDVSVLGQPLFDALNRLTDTMRLRWDRDKEGGWLRFRSASFYDDRLKEVPNRLLARWSAARRQHGYISLDDLTEIAQLPDAQLDAASMAEGARACFGLTEWELARHPVLRPHLRYLAGFAPAQRQEAMSDTGLLFTTMSLAQQQGFIAHATPPWEPPLQSLDELAGSALWIDYTQPGWFQWVTGYGGPWQTWLMPVGSGPEGQRAPRPKVRERTREAALQALRRVDRDRKLRSAIWESRRRDDSGYTPPADEAAEIQPTTLDLVLIYIPGASHKRPIRIFAAGLVSGQWTE